MVEQLEEMGFNVNACQHWLRSILVTRIALHMRPWQWVLRSFTSYCDSILHKSPHLVSYSDDAREIQKTLEGFGFCTWMALRYTHAILSTRLSRHMSIARWVIRMIRSEACPRPGSPRQQRQRTCLPLRSPRQQRDRACIPFRSPRQQRQRACPRIGSTRQHRGCLFEFAARMHARKQRPHCARTIPRHAYPSLRARRAQGHNVRME